MMTYRIKWLAKETGEFGQGEPVELLPPDILPLLQKLNKETPELYHWAEWEEESASSQQSPDNDLTAPSWCQHCNENTEHEIHIPAGEYGVSLICTVCENENDGIPF